MQKNIIKKLGKYFEKQPGIHFVYLLGSVLTGQQHEESDVDFAVLFTEKPDINQHTEIINDLELILNQKVDLGILNDSSPVFRMQVLKKGKCIYLRNSKIHDYFVIRTVNEYDDLKYYRNIQEKNLMKGRIFA